MAKKSKAKTLPLIKTTNMRSEYLMNSFALNLVLDFGAFCFSFFFIDLSIVPYFGSSDGLEKSSLSDFLSRKNFFPFLPRLYFSLA